MFLVIQMVVVALFVILKIRNHYEIMEFDHNGSLLMVSGSIFQTISHYAMPLIRNKNPNVREDLKYGQLTVGILALTHMILANLAFTDYPGFCEEIFPCPISKIYS